MSRLHATSTSDAAPALEGARDAAASPLRSDDADVSLVDANVSLVLGGSAADEYAPWPPVRAPLHAYAAPTIRRSSDLSEFLRLEEMASDARAGHESSAQHTDAALLLPTAQGEHPVVMYSVQERLQGAEESKPVSPAATGAGAVNATLLGAEEDANAAAASLADYWTRTHHVSQPWTARGHWRDTGSHGAMINATHEEDTHDHIARGASRSSDVSRPSAAAPRRRSLEDGGARMHVHAVHDGLQASFALQHTPHLRGHSEWRQALEEEVGDAASHPHVHAVHTPSAPPSQLRAPRPRSSGTGHTNNSATPGRARDDAGEIAREVDADRSTLARLGDLAAPPAAAAADSAPRVPLHRRRVLHTDDVRDDEMHARTVTEAGDAPTMTRAHAQTSWTISVPVTATSAHAQPPSAAAPPQPSAQRAATSVAVHASPAAPRSVSQPKSAAVVEHRTPTRSVSSSRHSTPTRGVPTEDAASVSTHRSYGAARSGGGSGAPRSAAAARAVTPQSAASRARPPPVHSMPPPAAPRAHVHTPGTAATALTTASPQPSVRQPEAVVLSAAAEAAAAAGPEQQALFTLVAAKVQALNEHIATYEARMAALAEARAAVGAEMQALNKERAEARGRREAEAAKFEAWKEEFSRRAEADKRSAVRQARAAAMTQAQSVAAASGSSAAERTELEAARAQIAKLQADLTALEVKHKAAMDRHAVLAARRNERIAQLEAQVSAYEAARVTTVGVGTLARAAGNDAHSVATATAAAAPSAATRPGAGGGSSSSSSMASRAAGGASAAGSSMRSSAPTLAAARRGHVAASQAPVLAPEASPQTHKDGVYAEMRYEGVPPRAAGTGLPVVPDVDAAAPSAYDASAYQETQWEEAAAVMGVAASPHSHASASPPSVVASLHASASVTGHVGGGGSGGGGGGGGGANASITLRPPSSPAHVAPLESVSSSGDAGPASVYSGASAGVGNESVVPASAAMRRHFACRFDLAALTSTPASDGHVDMVSERIAEDGKRECRFVDGTRIVYFKNGTQKESLAAGNVIVRFSNGDVKHTFPTRSAADVGAASFDTMMPVEAYYYAQSMTLHTTYECGVDAFDFGSGQTELHFRDGHKEIAVADDGFAVLKAAPHATPQP